MLGSLCRMLVAGLTFCILPAEAVTFTPVYQFKGGAYNDGAFPVASLISDSTGLLYGTTAGGGGTGCKVGCGTVFSIDPTTGVETPLYSFQGEPYHDGAVPVAGLFMDASGNLYGTTSEGGDGGSCNGNGCGTVFKLAPASKLRARSRTWNYTVLYSFKGGSDGQDPRASLIQDPSSGILYGTTAEGGVADCGYFGIGCGTVFSITTDGSTKTTLHAFTGAPYDGENPRAALIIDSGGNLYGTTMSGGDKTNSSKCVYESCGTVFELAQDGTETVLHSFQGAQKSDGGNPVSSVVLDTNGNLDGATLYGGLSDYCFGYGCGTVFQLQSTGGYNMYAFSPDQGEAPVAGLVEDPSGLFESVACGEACNGGRPSGRPGKNNCGKGCHYGTVYQIQTSGTTINSTSLYSFDNTTGSAPSAPLLLSGSTLYGTTQNGGLLQNCPGNLGCGTVFSITLNQN